MDENKIANPALMINMLRDAGYKNTSYAIAEIVDNSIEANAKNIRITLFEEKITTVRTQKLIGEVAIFDDGEGMPENVLAKCLSFGWGTRLDGATGLGKFGFGLKGASISQAQRIEVYSWQTPDNVMMTYLDCEEIEDTKSDLLPIPQKVKVPARYLPGEHSELPETGTIIVWKNLDRLKPKKSATVISHLNNEMCRIFRHFLDDNDNYGTQRNISVQVIDPSGVAGETVVLKANDPLYLLTPNNCPEHNDDATNVIDDETVISVTDPDGQPAEIRVISTIALPRIQRLGGNSKVGVHYAKNTGISFVRAGRELELDHKGFFSVSDPRYRWIGIEVRFKPQLDEYFGVSNNKQGIRNFKNFDDAEIRDLTEDLENLQGVDKYRAEMMLELHKVITRFVGSAYDTVKSRGSRNSSNEDKPAGDKREEKFSDDVKDIDGNEKTRSENEAKNKTEEQKLKELAELKMESDSSLTFEEALEIAKIELSYAVQLEENSWPGNTFLDVEYKGNSAIGLVNRRHAFFTQFYDNLRLQDDQKGFDALRVFLMAFVRCEDVLQQRIGTEAFEDIRSKWGEYLRNMSKYVD